MPAPVVVTVIIDAPRSATKRVSVVGDLSKKQVRELEDALDGVLKRFVSGESDGEGGLPLAD